MGAVIRCWIASEADDLLPFFFFVVFLTSRSELNGKNEQLKQMALKLEEYKENMLKVT